VASIAYNEPVPVVDGNVIRVLTRLFDVADCADDTVTRNRLWNLAATLVPKNAPGDFNQAIMELGARMCTPKTPQCDGCPVRMHCAARAAGVQDRRPVRRAKKRVPHHEIVVAAIRKSGRYLLGKRPSGGLLGGLWEFPGGKVQPGETHQRALKRELKEELGITVRVGGLIASVNHAYSHFKVTLNVYRCEHVSGTPEPKTHTELKWVLPSQFARYAFPKANHKFLDLLGDPD
jgi:A/G-specific adenine glycosylase